MPKSSFQPTVRVWQGGSGEGQIWGEGCVQSSTQTAGGVFQGDKVCVCRPGHEPVRPFDLKWHRLNPRGEKLQSIQWSVTSQINPNLAVYLHQDNDLWPCLTASAPGHTNTLSTRTIPVPWSPLEPRILKHSSIWFIIKEYEVYDELSLFYILQWMKKKVETNS